MPGLGHDAFQEALAGSPYFMSCGSGSMLQPAPPCLSKEPGMGKMGLFLLPHFVFWWLILSCFYCKGHVSMQVSIPTPQCVQVRAWSFLRGRWC